MLTIADPSAVPAARSFVHWVCDPVAASVPQVRSRVRAVLDDWRVPVDVVDVLLVVVSELVGNVVRHAGVAGRMRVAVVEGGGWLRLEVADRGSALPRLPAPRTEVDAESEGGRGLLMVQLLTTELGGELSVVAREFGKAVRVRIPVPRVAARRPEGALV
ncbi:ATP-binding protein [Streptomyces sp. NBC_01207]|uniref:ATP-binding protein n=1 Tax=Streptomyces sp. NBC_01207 TaxID=2903772 RepID=UPI002E0F1E6F|nr:ATP-binding protein [Streptomyces sp. NBC_01207]